MNKPAQFIPILIVTINALAILGRWSHLPELLPAHFDLQGNASGSMSRNLLLFYPLASAAVSLIAYVISLKMHRLQTSLIILASGICLVLLFSTLVTLTSGSIPFFMLAEPIILLASVIASVICMIRTRKK